MFALVQEGVVALLEGKSAQFALPAPKSMEEGFSNLRKQESTNSEPFPAFVPPASAYTQTTQPSLDGDRAPREETFEAATKAQPSPLRPEQPAVARVQPVMEPTASVVLPPEPQTQQARTKERAQLVPEPTAEVMLPPPEPQQQQARTVKRAPPAPEPTALVMPLPLEAQKLQAETEATSREDKQDLTVPPKMSAAPLSQEFPAIEKRVSRQQPPAESTAQLKSRSLESAPILRHKPDQQAPKPSVQNLDQTPVASPPPSPTSAEPNGREAGQGASGSGAFHERSQPSTVQRDLQGTEQLKEASRVSEVQAAPIDQARAQAVRGNDGLQVPDTSKGASGISNEPGKDTTGAATSLESPHNTNNQVRSDSIGAEQPKSIDSDSKAGSGARGILNPPSEAGLQDADRESDRPSSTAKLVASAIEPPTSAAAHSIPAAAVPSLRTPDAEGLPFHERTARADSGERLQAEALSSMSAEPRQQEAADIAPPLQATGQASEPGPQRPFKADDPLSGLRDSPGSHPAEPSYGETNTKQPESESRPALAGGAVQRSAADAPPAEPPSSSSPHPLEGVQEAESRHHGANLIASEPGTAAAAQASDTRDVRSEEEALALPYQQEPSEAREAVREEVQLPAQASKDPSVSRLAEMEGSKEEIETQPAASALQ